MRRFGTRNILYFQVNIWTDVLHTSFSQAPFQDAKYRVSTIFLIFIAEFYTMEEKSAAPNKKPSHPAKKHKQEVYVLRDIREYFGESLLIIFSVFLALVVTE